MVSVKFTNKKQCPYCGNTNIEYIDLTDIFGTTPRYDQRLKADKYVFKCKDCKELFYYTGKLDLAMANHKS